VRTRSVLVLGLWASVLLAGCSDDAVSNEEQARKTYFGLDTMVQKAMDLGFAGFNAASSANIPAQSGTGAVSGSINITGQVDQGSSANKGMRLKVELIGYQDDKTINVVYATNAAALPALELQLKSIPTGTLSGTLSGVFTMTGDLKGDVTLSLTMAGQLQADPADAKKVIRKPGTTTVTGTATSAFGTYAVNVVR
jgi:hypothetical protein